MIDEPPGVMDRKTWQELGRKRGWLPPEHDVNGAIDRAVEAVGATTVIDWCRDFFAEHAKAQAQADAAMTDVIHLHEHRESPGTLWYGGLVCCTRCGHTHVAVVAQPSWAMGPPPVECSACHAIACLAVVEGHEPRAWAAPHTEHEPVEPAE